MIKAELIDRGFKVITTGGNCEAFQIFYDDEKLYEILIAQECSLPVDDQGITIVLIDTINNIELGLSRTLWFRILDQLIMQKIELEQRQSHFGQRV